MRVEDASHLNARPFEAIEHDVRQNWKRTSVEAELGSLPSDAWVPRKQPFQRRHDAKHEPFRGICPDALGVIAPDIV